MLRGRLEVWWGLGGVLAFGLGLGWGDTSAFWMEIFFSGGTKSPVRTHGRSLFFFLFSIFLFFCGNGMGLDRMGLSSHPRYTISRQGGFLEQGIC